MPIIVIVSYQHHSNYHHKSDYPYRQDSFLVSDIVLQRLQHDTALYSGESLLTSEKYVSGSADLVRVLQHVSNFLYVYI